MAKLYVFAIGGSGSRVLKSLTMLLAAGVKCDVDTIVPIIIDKDASCFKDTQELIENYIKVQEYAPKSEGNVQNKFFNTKFELLNNELVLALDDAKDTFRSYINYDTPQELKNTKPLVDVLFSERTLNMSTSVGFQGNPNIGSVVLNQFTEQKIFKSFGDKIENGDKIFIISSIFGGTGASGFPLLLKTLNNPPAGLTAPDNIKKAAKGAITILPYFKVSSDKDENNKDSLVPKTFIPGTKAALHYYETLDKKIDSLYYIGEPSGFRLTYKHEKGGSKQEEEDKAHIVELAAALSVIDFTNNTSIKRKSDGIAITATTYKEFGITAKVREETDKQGKTRQIENDGRNVSFNDLADNTKELLKKPLLQLLLMRKFISEKFKYESKQPYLAKLGINTNFFEGDCSMKSMHEILSKYYSYLQDIEGDEKEKEKRKFAPFSLETDNPFNILKNENVKTGWSQLFGTNGWTWFVDKLNSEIDAVNNSINDTNNNNLTEKRFIELLYRVTEQFYNRLNKK
ncbi:hypothetical protein FACS189437_01780 [Bacteroidia bacterium]|nr:hypothetical protein FACS189437_01780 [Bacteroidia bacterium]